MTKKPQTITGYRPAEDRRVRKPDGALLAEGGEVIELNAYYSRLLSDGDIETVELALPADDDAQTEESAK